MSSLLERISLSHDRPSDDSYQESVLRDVFAYLFRLDTSEHLFCDPKNYPMAIHALILFSFMNSEALEWYKPRIATALSTCYDCLVKFQHGRCELKESFLIRRKIDFISVKEFNDIILSWESERVVDSLENLLTYIQIPSTPLKSDIKLTLTECLISPGMFIVKPLLKNLFSRCFIICLSRGLFTPPATLFPALIHLLFEGNTEEKIWCVEYLKTVSSIDCQNWDSLMTEEFLVHLVNIQDPKFYSDENCIRFWSNFKPFLILMTPEAIQTKLLNIPALSIIGKSFPFQVVPLNVVLTNQLFAFLDLPLAILLSVLNIFLIKLESNFWKVVKPFTFLNFLDPIFGSPHYVKYLRSPVPQMGHNANYKIQDLFSWIQSLYNSLSTSPSQKQQAGLRISLFLLSQVHNGINNGFIIDNAFKILVDCSIVHHKLHDQQLPLELVSKIDTRGFLNMKTELLVDIARGGNNYKPDLSVTSIDQVTNKLRSRAVVIISHAILYDVYCFAEKGYHLKENKDINLGNLAFDQKFWDEVTNKFKLNDIPMAIEVLNLLSEICCINPINNKLFCLQHKITEDNKNSSSITKHLGDFNKGTSILFGKVSKLLGKFNSFDGLLLKVILTDPRSAEGFWSCMLSSDKGMYQSATNLLYEAYDVEGRLEGVKAVTIANPHAVLSSILKSLEGLAFIDFYDPCPSAVRLLMDIVGSLNDAVNGVFIEMTRSSVSEVVVEDLRKFWKSCWKFLDFIYQKTLNWAQIFPLSLLTDFTRDTLDLSHMLLDCYQTVESIVGDKSLFMDILNTFQNMLVWLRLGDMSLLASCVALVFKTLDLAEEKNLPMDRKIIELLAQYGAKAKRFNNKLTEKQRIDILDRARSFDEDLVDKIVEKAEGYRESAAIEKQKALQAEHEIVEIEDDDDDGLEDDNSIVEPRRIKQTNLAKFISRSNSPMVAPLPKKPPLKMSLLLATKLSLANKRTVGTKGAAAPAPPRPAGFNRKRQLNSDSDSSDSDSDDGVNSLFHPIKKTKTISHKLKTNSLAIPSRSLSINKNQQKKRVDQKELDAYNMRMRLNVDLSPLYKTVLSWNYARVDQYPDELKEKLDVYKRIKDKFNTTQEYIETFEPLLLLECWQAIQQSKQIGQETPFPIVVGSRTTTNAFFEVYASIKRDIVQDRRISDSDMIVLAFDADNSFRIGKYGAPTSDSIKTARYTCLAKIKEMKVVNPEFCDITLRVSSSHNSLVSFLTPRTEIFGMKVMQMTTIEREYSSLKGLPYYDLSKQIIQGIPNIPEQLDSSEKEKMRKLYDVNPSQAQAIAGSVHANGFSLIQGPPGTGKTKTILGIIGYLLTSTRNMSVQTINVPEQKISESPQLKKNKSIFICAPSNAAVDELVLRLRSGIKNASGVLFNPRVIRLGRSDAINPAVRDLTLEELVDKELNAKEGAESATSDPKIREEHNRCIQERNEIKAKLQQSDLTPEDMDSLNQKLRKCVQRKNELGKQLDEQREMISKSNRTREIERRAIQAKLLTEAQVICSTLSGSAHDVIASLSLTFDTVVIDEAAQCIELSAIIPLRYGCKKCIMVGDPNQLPPTVLSQAAASYSYEQSLFVRMQTKHPDSVYLLDVQYRMHPEISKFPSAQFYESKLIDGPHMREINTRPWHKENPFKPYLFYDIVGAQHSQNQRTKSFFNTSEAKVALELVEKLFKDYYQENWSGRIGIISPYKEQVNVIRESFVRKFGSQILREIDFNTIDGYQGQEKEIIIMSCVRASDSSGVGFLSDVRRMNVALTRSKTSLWILGSRSSLSKNEVWLNLIDDAEKRNVLIKAGPGFLKNENLFKNLKDHKASNQSEFFESPKVVPNTALELSNSGTLRPAPLRLSKPLIERVEKPKPKSRVTVPFGKQRNVLTADTLKKSTSSSGSLPKVGAGFEANPEVKSDSQHKKPPSNSTFASVISRTPSVPSSLEVGGPGFELNRNDHNIVQTLVDNQVPLTSLKKSEKTLQKLINSSSSGVLPVKDMMREIPQKVSMDPRNSNKHIESTYSATNNISVGQQPSTFNAGGDQLTYSGNLERPSNQIPSGNDTNFSEIPNSGISSHNVGNTAFKLTKSGNLQMPSSSGKLPTSSQGEISKPGIKNADPQVNGVTSFTSASSIQPSTGFIPQPSGPIRANESLTLAAGDPRLRRKHINSPASNLAVLSSNPDISSNVVRSQSQTVVETAGILPENRKPVSGNNEDSLLVTMDPRLNRKLPAMSSSENVKKFNTENRNNHQDLYSGEGMSHYNPFEKSLTNDGRNGSGNFIPQTRTDDIPGRPNLQEKNVANGNSGFLLPQFSNALLDNNNRNPDNILRIPTRPQAFNQPPQLPSKYDKYNYQSRYGNSYSNRGRGGYNNYGSNRNNYSYSNLSSTNGFNNDFSNSNINDSNSSKKKKKKKKFANDGRQPGSLPPWHQS